VDPHLRLAQHHRELPLCELGLFANGSQEAREVAVPLRVLGLWH
jgi:hypothetical protein